MKAVLAPTPLCGTVRVPLSKSWLHRALICAALADGSSFIDLNGADAAELSDDILATLDCLTALGAAFIFEKGGIAVSPAVSDSSQPAALHCRESGSTLRFLLPIVGALGREAAITADGRLPQRPLSPLREELTAHGMTLSPQFPLCLSGRLQSGIYTLRGDVSSQFITGLLLALPSLDGDSEIRITGPLESEPYIALTCGVLERFGVSVVPTPTGYRIPGRQRCRGTHCTAEGDWSGAAFPLAAGALGGCVTVTGLELQSKQGDRAIVDILRRFGADVTVDRHGITARKTPLRAIELDAAAVPDLVPAVAAVACVAEGTTVIRGAARLRLKESDRLLALQTALGALGADVTQTEDGLIIRGKPVLNGGTADPFGDHRIAMAAAIAATVCKAPVTVTSAQCVRKSYPPFFEHLRALDGEITLSETEEA